MADKTFAPHWEVGEDTWKAAARLAGWLFAKVIKATPTKNNVHYHHDWSATECPGPYMDSIRGEVLAEVQKWYAHFTEDHTTPSSPHPTTPAKKSVAEVAKEVIAGKWGNGDTRTSKLKAAGYDPKAVQAEVNKQLGHTGGKKSVHTLALEVLAGQWGNGDERKSRLTKAGYDYNAVQQEVNRIS
jgi:N-acetylmuramoyl-L-alanine amidase CwlA